MDSPGQLISDALRHTFRLKFPCTPISQSPSSLKLVAPQCPGLARESHESTLAVSTSATIPAAGPCASIMLSRLGGVTAGWHLPLLVLLAHDFFAPQFSGSIELVTRFQKHICGRPPAPPGACISLKSPPSTGDSPEDRPRRPTAPAPVAGDSTCTRSCLSSVGGPTTPSTCAYYYHLANHTKRSRSTNTGVENLPGQLRG